MRVGGGEDTHDSAPAQELSDTAPETVSSHSDHQSIGRDSGALFAMQVAGNGGFFFAILLVARALGPAGRGTLGFLTVTAQIIATLSKVGLTQATTVLAAQRTDERRAILANLILFSAVGSLLIGVIVAGVFMVLPGSRPADLSVTQLVIFPVAAMATSLWDESFLIGCGHIRQLAVRAAAGGWIYSLLVAVIWISHGLTVTAALVAWTVAQFSVATLLHAEPIRREGFGRPDLALLRASVRFGSRAWLGTFSTFLNARFDQMLMGFITTESTLGIYAVAVNASEPVLLVPTAIASALLPTVARDAGFVAPARTLRIFRLTVVIAALTAAVAAAIGSVLLPVVFGARFRPSVVPFLWLLPGALGFVAMSLFTSALLGRSSPGRSSLGPFAALVVGALLDVTLIPLWGADGAAIAASGAFFAGGTIATVLFWRHERFVLRSLVCGRADVRELGAIATGLARRFW